MDVSVVTKMASLAGSHQVVIRAVGRTVIQVCDGEDDLHWFALIVAAKAERAPVVHFPMRRI
jgi:hypothetical protein